MCGIVGYIGHRDAAPLILESLKKLEYRGYDSAGIAVVNGGHVSIRRCKGKLKNLERVLLQRPVRGNVGIGPELREDGSRYNLPPKRERASAA